MYLIYFRSLSHVSLILRIFYWHFVDVIWVFLYIFIYCWGR
jgi:cytochrome c oxidase subunit 3